jgi:hypothetical protein
MSNHLFPDMDPVTTAPLFPEELAPPTPEQEQAYSAAARKMRKAGDDPVENREKFEKNYASEKKRRR